MHVCTHVLTFIYFLRLNGCLFYGGVGSWVPFFRLRGPFGLLLWNPGSNTANIQVHTYIHIYIHYYCIIFSQLDDAGSRHWPLNNKTKQKWGCLKQSWLPLFLYFWKNNNQEHQITQKDLKEYEDMACSIAWSPWQENAKFSLFFHCFHCHFTVTLCLLPIQRHLC